MKIVIDVDSTLIDTTATIVNLHNKLYPANKLIYTHDHDWNFSPIIKTEKELHDLFQLFYHKDFYDLDVLVMIDDAYEVINKLSTKHDVTFCSVHSDKRKPITSKFIKNNFPNCKIMYVNDFHEKRNVACDILVDDKIESLNGDAKVSLCFGSYKWNRDYTGLRLETWNDIYKYLQ